MADVFIHTERHAAFNVPFEGVGGQGDGFDESGLFTSCMANFTNRNDGNIQDCNGSTVLTTLTYNHIDAVFLFDFDRLLVSFGNS